MRLRELLDGAKQRAEQKVGSPSSSHLNPRKQVRFRKVGVDGLPAVTTGGHYPDDRADAA